MNLGEELLQLYNQLDQTKDYTEQEIFDLAQTLGLDTFKKLSIDTLLPMPEIREMCNPKQCPKYDKQWTCPPNCGTLEELTAEINKYDYGYLVQTIGELEDDFDIETMQETEKIHKRAVMELNVHLKPQFTSTLPMPAGACNLCKECTYPDNPCRYPQFAAPSMEASGLFVSDVCQKNDVKYYYGPQTMAYTSCILIKP